MPTVISVTNASAYPKRNQAEFLFRKFVEYEYQFEMSAGYEKKVFIEFNKGVWEITAGKYAPVTLLDSFMVNDEGNPLSEAFIKSRMELHLENAHEGENIYRTVPAKAMWDFVRLAINGFEDEKTITFVIDLPGRDGETATRPF
jgi:hypothetical protein